MGTNNGCSRSRNPINNRALHQPGLQLMLACRACKAPPRHSHVWSKHMEWALSIGTLTNTIRSILVYPKEKTPDAQKCGLVYQVECPECPPHIHGQTGRTLATRTKYHLNLRNPVLNSCGRTLCAQTPQITKDSVRVLDREEIRLKRKVREASEIKIGQAAMNRDQGYLSSPIYD